MSITYYPNGVAKPLMHVIEKLQQPNRLYSLCGEQVLTDDDLNITVWSPRSWEVLRVSLNFTTTDTKDYSISTMRGIGIVSGLNDRLWFKMDAISSQQIIIPQLFYDGATMATAVETAMNASYLPATGMPFVVAYDSDTNKFTITPNAGNIKLFVTNTCVPVRRESTAARLLGFTVDSTPANPIESDTEVPALGTKTIIVSGTDSVSQNVVSTDVIAMTVDNQLVIEATASSQANSTSSSSSITLPMVATYEVVYRILDV